MNENTGVDYIAAWQLNQPISGFGGVGIVVHSRSNGFTNGDVVIKSDMLWPWQRYSVMSASQLSKVLLRYYIHIVLFLIYFPGFSLFYNKNKNHPTSEVIGVMNNSILNP